MKANISNKQILAAYRAVSSIQKYLKGTPSRVLLKKILARSSKIRAISETMLLLIPSIPRLFIKRSIYRVFKPYKFGFRDHVKHRPLRPPAGLE